MTTQTAELDVDLITTLRDAVPVPLVLHGSSGVPDDTLREAVRAGILKVNIGTALNVAYTGALRLALAAAAKVDPRPSLTAAREAVTDTVAHLIEVIGG
jgi:fructose-bisphosphate aldolase class II